MSPTNKELEIRTSMPRILEGDHRCKYLSVVKSPTNRTIDVDVSRDTRDHSLGRHSHDEYHNESKAR